MNGSRFGEWSSLRRGMAVAALAALAWGVGSMPAQRHAKPSRSAAHAAGRPGSRSSAGTAGRAAAKAKARARGSGRNATRRTGLRASARPGSRSGYGTGARTSFRATINPESRLDLIAGLADTLAHGATAVRYPAALANFYAALTANAAQPASLPVRVLQFGDSHTAADMFTGEARRVFQGQFGNGGVGFTYPGHPFAGYRILGSSRSQSPGWTTLGTHFTDLGDAMTGMGGVALQTFRAGDSITEDAPCTSFEIQYLQQAGGGTLQVTDNGAPAGQIDTSSAAAGAGAATGAGSWHYDCPAAPGFEYTPHHFVATTLTDAPVRLLGTVALQPGVTWEAMGINGAEAPLMLRWEQTLFTTYLARTAASLIVLAYGTNEAAAKWTYEGYSEVFARLVDKLHATLPNAAVLVLGPTDRAIAMRRRGYSTYAGTERIVEAQRDVCRTHGCAFWDAQQRMGGFGSMQRWVLAGWAQPDHTHFTGEGYRTLADALLADLLSGYDAYRVAHGLPSTPLRSTGAGGSPGSTASPGYGAAGAQPGGYSGAYSGTGPGASTGANPGTGPGAGAYPGTGPVRPITLPPAPPQVPRQ